MARFQQRSNTAWSGGGFLGMAGAGKAPAEAMTAEAPGRITPAMDIEERPPAEERPEVMQSLLKSDTQDTLRVAEGSLEGTREGSSGLVVHSAAQLLEQTFVDAPIIGGLLDKRENLLIVGRSGIGKSLLALNIALDLSVPAPGGLWGLFPVPRQVTSLIIQSENTAKTTQARIRAITSADPRLLAGCEHVKFAGKEYRLVGSLSDQSFLDGVREAVKLAKAGLLIVDPLISYHGEDENDNGAMRRCLDCLTLLMEQTGCAVILIHHAGKGTGPAVPYGGRGASAIGDWAANILQLERVNRGPGEPVIIRCIHAKARNFEQRPDFFLERTPSLTFRLVDGPSSGGKEFRAQAVVLALRAMGGRAGTQQELTLAITKANGVEKTTARKWIDAALALGLIRKIGSAGQRGVGYELAELSPHQAEQIGLRKVA